MFVRVCVLFLVFRILSSCLSLLTLTPAATGSTPLFHALKKVVLEGILRGDPPRGIVLKHPVEKINALLVESGNQACQSTPRRRIGGKSIRAVFGKFHNSWKVPGWLGGSQEPKDSVQLVLL